MVISMLPMRKFQQCIQGSFQIRLAAYCGVVVFKGDSAIVETMEHIAECLYSNRRESTVTKHIWPSPLSRLYCNYFFPKQFAERMGRMDR